MTFREFATPPLAVVSMATPNWINDVQGFWSIVLPAGGAILLGLQIAYYWKILRK